MQSLKRGNRRISLVRLILTERIGLGAVHLHDQAFQSVHFGHQVLPTYQVHLKFVHVLTRHVEELVAEGNALLLCVDVGKKRKKGR